MRARRSIKCLIEPCKFRGRDAVKKSLERTTPPWRFYMRREIAIHRALREIDLPVRVPKMLDADAEAGFIVFERAVGEPLAVRRHSPPKDRDTWKELVAVARAIRTISCAIDVKPTREDVAAMRARLLEDPTAPREWITSGLRACAERGLIAEESAERLAKDVKGAVFQHGDLLCRNVVRDAKGLVVVDWECAGTHADGWDAALLSVFAPPWAREELAKGCDAASYRACYAFALLREIAFREGKWDAIRTRLEDELQRATL